MGCYFFCVSQTTTHEALAQELCNVIEDPSKINLNVSKGLVESCYFPIVQSGGEYQLKASLAQALRNEFLSPLLLLVVYYLYDTGQKKIAWGCFRL